MIFTIMGRTSPERSSKRARGSQPFARKGDKIERERTEKKNKGGVPDWEEGRRRGGEGIGAGEGRDDGEERESALEREEWQIERGRDVGGWRC